MLGFATGTKVDNENYLTSHGPIWLDKLRCNGKGWDIAECSHNGWGIHNCKHRDDVAVSSTGTNLDQVRLNGGRDPREGQLEVLYDGVWRDVCHVYPSEASARVVCNMLGFGYIGRVINNNFGVRVAAAVRFSRFQCRGTEHSITDCSGVSATFTYCRSVAVSCLRNNAVTLFGGGSPREGRIELYHNGRWGTVCNDRFTDAAARVVCYSLGFGYVGYEVNINTYGIGIGVIWLDDVQCNGTERHVSECSHSGWGVHNCVHKEDVAVSCIPDSSTTVVTLTSSVLSSSITSQMTSSPPMIVNSTSIQSTHHTTKVSNTDAPCSHEGSVVLVGGRSSREGRLQVCHKGIWGTVCDDGFTDAAARVVCYSLGYGFFGYEVNINTYGIGSGVIWLDDIQCNGSERHVSECSHSGWGVHSCVHKEDVAVSCISDSSTTVVELTGSVLSSRITSQMTSSPPLIVNSTTIQSTRRTTQASNTDVPCSHEGSVALVGGRSSREGRLQVCHKSIWGTVCDDGFTDAAARVVCYSLGYGFFGYKVNINTYGIGSGVIWLDDVQCNGMERQISECSHSGWGVHNCVHKEDVAVSCIRDSSSTTVVTSKSSISVSQTYAARSTLRSATSTQDSSYHIRSTSPAATSKTTSHPMLISTTSIRSSINRTPADTTHIIYVSSDNTPLILAVAIVGGLLLILIIIVIVIAIICFVHFLQKPRQQRTEMAMIPMTASASTNIYNNDSFGEAAKYENPPVNDQAYNTYSDIQPSSSPAAGSVDNVVSGDKPFAMYDMLLDDQ